MIHRIPILLLLLFINERFALSQNTIKLAHSKILQVNTIEWADSNISSIYVIDSALKNEAILVLAEANHGDGSSYNAQCMILKGLIDSGKVNTIYTESSWVNINAIVDILHTEGIKSISKTKELMRSVELRYWVNNGFWDYLARKIITKKVELFGFDIEGISSKIVIPLFEEACKIPSVQVYLTENASVYKGLQTEYFQYDGWEAQSMYYEVNYLKQKKFIEVILAHYKSINDSLKIAQWKTVLDCFYWMSQRSKVLADNKYSNVIESDLQQSEFHRIRDSLMAEVFYKSFSKKENHRAVILMSAYHALKMPQSIKDVSSCCIGSGVKTMGEILTTKFRINLFNICFIAGSGEHGLNYSSDSNMKYWQVKKPIKGSIEYFLKKTPYDYCVIKLSDIFEKEFYMNVLFDRYLKADWRKNFDAVFYIKKMKPLVFKDISYIASAQF